MNKVFKHLSLAVAVSAAMVSTQALAYEEGDWIVRVGATMVDPDASSSIVTVDGVDAFAGSKVDVEDDTQLGLNIEYMISPNLGIELLAATPFEHTVKAKGTLATALSPNGGTDVASVKQLPPTLSLNYHFDTNSAWQPYIVVGINYTVFFSEDGSSELEATLGSDTDVELDDSWGLAAQAGVNYHVDDKWLINASVRYIDISTDAEITIKANGAKIETDVDVDPYVYTLSVGYKF
jgi:outer membrane protein